MLIQILVCCVIMVSNVVIHAAGMSVGLRFFVSKYLPTMETASILTRSLVVAALILVMFVTTLIEASVWAATYTLVGAIPNSFKARLGSKFFSHRDPQSSLRHAPSGHSKP